MGSVVDDLINNQEKLKKIQETALENEKKFRGAINTITDTPEGMYFFKCLVKFVGLYHDNPSLDSAKLIEDKGRKSVYLRLIRPYLNPDSIKEIESL